MSIDNNAGFNRRNFLKSTGAAAVPASFFIGGAARAQTPTTLNMLTWFTGSEAGK